MLVDDVWESSRQTKQWNGSILIIIMGIFVFWASHHIMYSLKEIGQLELKTLYIFDFKRNQHILNTPTHYRAYITHGLSISVVNLPQLFPVIHVQLFAIGQANSTARVHIRLRIHIYMYGHTFDRCWCNTDHIRWRQTSMSSHTRTNNNSLTS